VAPRSLAARGPSKGHLSRGWATFGDIDAPTQMLFKALDDPGVGFDLKLQALLLFGSFRAITIGP